MIYKIDHLNNFLIEIFSNHQKLVELGLDLPVTAYLENALKSANCNIESDLTVDDFVQKTALALKGGQR